MSILLIFSKNISDLCLNFYEVNSKYDYVYFFISPQRLKGREVSPEPGGLKY